MTLLVVSFRGREQRVLYQTEDFVVYFDEQDNQECQRLITGSTEDTEDYVQVVKSGNVRGSKFIGEPGNSWVGIVLGSNGNYYTVRSWKTMNQVDFVDSLASYGNNAYIPFFEVSEYDPK